MSLISLICALFNRLPPKALRLFVEYGAVRPAVLWSQKKGITSNLRRILERTGQEAGPERIRALLEELVEVQTRFTMLIFLSKHELRYCRENVELPALEKIQELRDEGRGVILATPHLGLVFHAMLALEGKVPWKMVFPRPERVSHAPAWLKERLLPLGSCAADCMRALRSNEAVIGAPDLNLAPARKPAVFFGAPAPFSRGAARMARLSGAPILPVYAVSHDGGARCVLECDEPIRLKPGPDAIDETTRLLAGSIERWVGRYPGQWLVGFDYWKLRRAPFDYRVSAGSGWKVEGGRLE